MWFGRSRAPPTKRADLYSWAVRQADLLRAGQLSEVDPVAIAEEIDDAGGAVRQADLLRAGQLSEVDPVAIAEEIDDAGEKNTTGSKALCAS
jgi:hypothetical protein